MTGTGRRGGTLLVGLAVGALLVGAVAVAVPGGSGVPWVGLTGTPATATLDPVGVVVPVPVLPQPELPDVARLLPPAPPTTPATPEPAAPEPAVPPEVAPPVPADLGPAAEVVALTNAERARAGCGALRTDDRLTAAARGHSADMAERDYFAHDTPDGVTFVDRILAAGHPEPGAENIARGQPSAAVVMADWMNSPGHRRNILNCDLASIGVGLEPRGNYWTQNFGY